MEKRKEKMEGGKKRGRKITTEGEIVTEEEEHQLLGMRTKLRVIICFISILCPLTRVRKREISAFLKKKKSHPSFTSCLDARNNLRGTNI